MYYDATGKGIDYNRANVQKEVYPVIKLGVEQTYIPLEDNNTKCLVIKASDLIQRSGLTLKPIFYDITKAGGIHAYLGYSGKVILSSVMPDRTLSGLTKERYGQLIRETGADSYFTPDGETYLDRKHIAEKEIERIIEETRYLQSVCRNSKPIGLVKGSNSFQVESHASLLHDAGISTLVFHTGDYLRRNNKKEILIGSIHARIVRKYAKTLLVSGIGSRRNLLRYAFADAFITQSHFTNALNYRQLMKDGRWICTGQEANRFIIAENLRQIKKEVELLNGKRGLNGCIQESIEEEEPLLFNEIG
jgi:hypothetical protein